MPALSPATRRANAQRRFNLNRELQRLMNYYEGSYRGRFGRTASVPQSLTIRGLAQELAARRIQKAVRARQTRQARQRATALAIAHTSARAPRNLVAAVAYNPNRVARLRRNYGLHANNF